MHSEERESAFHQNDRNESSSAVEDSITRSAVPMRHDPKEPAMTADIRMTSGTTPVATPHWQCPATERV